MVGCWERKIEVYFKRPHPQRGLPPSPPISVHRVLSVSSFLFSRLRLMSDTESSTLKWPRTCSPSPKVKMRNRLRIPITMDQMNGRDFERLISLSQSVWSWRLLQRPRETTLASEILPAIPVDAVETGKYEHTFYTPYLTIFWSF